MVKTVIMFVVVRIAKGEKKYEIRVLKLELDHLATASGLEESALVKRDFHKAAKLPYPIIITAG